MRRIGLQFTEVVIIIMHQFSGFKGQVTLNDKLGELQGSPLSQIGMHQILWGAPQSVRGRVTSHFDLTYNSALYGSASKGELARPCEI